MTKDSEIRGKSADIAERAQKIKKKTSVCKGGQTTKSKYPQKWTEQKQASVKADKQ